MPTLAVPDMCSPRPREKGVAKSTHYGIRLSDKDLTAIDEIQRLLRRQTRPKQAVSIPLAIRTAVATFAAQLRREEAKVKRLVTTSPLDSK